MVKEVPEVAPECFEPEGEECSSGGTNRILNTTKSGVPLDDTQVYSHSSLSKTLLCSLMIFQ